MSLPLDLLRLVVSYLPVIKIYSLLYLTGDFLNENFWEEKLIRDYLHAPLEQGLKFTHSYAKLYQKYHQFWHGPTNKFVGVRLSLQPLLYGIDDSDITIGDVLPTRFEFISNLSSTFSLWEKGKLFVYLDNKWIRMKKIKLIDKYPLDLCRFSSQWRVRLNLTPYLDQIQINRFMVYIEHYFMRQYIYISFFYDWRGVKYQITYPVNFNHSLPKKWIIVETIVENDQLYYSFQNQGQISIIK